MKIGQLNYKMNKLTIKADIPEQQFMEAMLNQKHSGEDVLVLVSLYALAHSWNYKDLLYYMKLLEINQEEEQDKYVRSFK